VQTRAAEGVASCRMGPKSRLRQHSPDAAGAPRGRQRLERARTDGAELEYEVSGRGEPAVFIHGAFIADTFRPLLAEPSLAGHYRLILYHRRGYAGSSRASEPVSVAQQAADCRALLHHLGVERAHVVGHSYGGIVALQLALDAPSVAHSLALLEPGLMVGAGAQGYRESLARGVERYWEAGAEVVVDEFLQGRWPGYRATLDRVLPGAFAQAVADAVTWFERDASGQLGWHFGEAEVRRGASASRPCPCSAARVTLSGPALARRTGCCWSGYRTPKGLSCPARRTSCRSRTREAWPRCLRPSGHATGSRLELPSRPTPSGISPLCAAVSNPQSPAV
jgi:pimeloyl-ACP methyl ester carboxylesterase